MSTFFRRSPNSLTNEEDVRTETVAFLRSFLDPYEIHLEAHLKGSGRADIAVPKSRFVIETKSPKVDCAPDIERDGETQLDQLTRYVRHLRAVEKQDLFASTERNDLDRDWIGILTNGKIWWGYRWEHAGSGFEPIDEMQGRLYQETLASQLQTFATREVSKAWIPENPYEAFLENRTKLDEVAIRSENSMSLETQRNIWEQLIRGSGIPVVPARRDKLYLDHVFLLAISRLIVAETRHEESPIERVIESGYASWLGGTQFGKVWLDELRERVSSFNWSARKVDVLRNLYEKLIEKVDRKLFGEYYTPDWLAGMIVESVLDEEWLRKSILAVYQASAPVPGIGFLDPTCGSGSFLFAAAQRIGEAIPRVIGKIDQGDQANIVLRLVNGIDIHPLAVEMAHATLFRAIKGNPTVEPQVYQGDSLLIQREFGEQDQIFAIDSAVTEAYFEYPPGSNDAFAIPRELADRDDFKQRLRTLVQSAQIGSKLPDGVTQNMTDLGAVKLEDSHKTLTKIISRHGNGIWEWYIRNQLAPHALSTRKVDRIASNPPWLRFSEIQDDQRKAEVQSKAEELKLWVGGKLATSYDIASLFVVETRNLYLSKSNQTKSAFVLNHAAINADSWQEFRKDGKNSATLSLLEKHYDDEILRKRPFHGTDACVVGLPGSEEPTRLVLKDKKTKLQKKCFGSKLSLWLKLFQQLTPPNKNHLRTQKYLVKVPLSYLRCSSVSIRTTSRKHFNLHERKSLGSNINPST